MRSMKQFISALVVGFAALVAAPFASADQYYDGGYDRSYSSRDYDDRYDDRDYNRSDYNRSYDRRDDRRSHRRHRNNALGVALAIGATALILSHDDHGYRGHRGYYRSHYRGHRGYRHGGWRGGHRRHGRGW